MRISHFVFAIMLVIFIVLGMKAGDDNHREQKQNAEVEGSASLASSRGGISSTGRANLFDLKRSRPTVLEGIPLTGRPHLIKSPYATDGPLIDIQGIAAGTKIECPTTKRSFLVPEMADSGPKLFTRRYQVPPFFPFITFDFDSASGGLADDPFAEGGSADHGAPRPSAMEILEIKGIVFEDGASAFYVPASSELVVRNTAAQLKIVDKFVRNLTEEGVPNRISVGGGFVETQ